MLRKWIKLEHFLSQTWSYFEDSWGCFGLAFLILFESMSPLGTPWIRVTWRSGWTSVSLPAFCDRVNFSRENLHFNLPVIQLGITGMTTLPRVYATTEYHQGFNLWIQVVSVLLPQVSKTKPLSMQSTFTNFECGENIWEFDVDLWEDDTFAVSVLIFVLPPGYFAISCKALICSGWGYTCNWCVVM